MEGTLGTDSPALGSVSAGSPDAARPSTASPTVTASTISAIGRSLPTEINACCGTEG